MKIELTSEEFNLLMNLLDAHVENLREWVATEEDTDMIKERDDYEALFSRLNEQEIIEGIESGRITEREHEI